MQTGGGVTELVTVPPHGGLVTVQFNPYLVIEHPIIRCVLRVNALWVGLWKYVCVVSHNPVGEVSHSYMHIPCQP